MTTVPPPPGAPPTGPLLERDHELAVLDAALSSLGRLVVIEGPPGVGKSSLVAEVMVRAAAGGMLVVAAAGMELERQMAFGVTGQLLGPLLAQAGPSGRAHLLDGAAAPARALFGSDPVPPGDSVEGGEGIIQGLYWLIENLAVEPGENQGVRPVLICVDDAHWSDDASLRFLVRLAARLPALPATIVVALRPREANGSPALEHLRAQRCAEVLRPGPLTDAGVEHLVRSRFPRAEAAFSRACGRASGGNPFVVGALLDELLAEGIAPSDEAAALVQRLVPGAASRPILVRLGRLPEPAVALARAVAVLGDRTPLPRAARLAGLSDDAAEDAADVLAEAQLLRPGDPLGFTHPLIGAAVEGDLPAFARARAHRRAAGLLAAAGSPSSAVAAHLLVCRPRGDPWVVDVLRDAARSATTAGQHRSAAELLARAIEEPPEESEQARVRVARAMAGAAAGEPGSDAGLAAALNLISEPRERAEALLTLARLLIGRADFGASARVADQGLAELGPDDPLTRPLLNVLLMATSRHAPRRLEALRRFEPLVAAARTGHLPDDPILCARLATRMATAGEPSELVRALARAALEANPLVDPSAHGIPFAFLAAGIYWIGDLTWCKDAAGAALDAARSQGSPLALMAASHWLAAACHQLGALDDAVVHADRALAIHREGWDALAGWTGAILTAIHLERADRPAARRALAVAVLTDAESLDWAFVLAARGGLKLAEGDAAGAFADLDGAGRHLTEHYRIDHPAVLPWRSLAAVAASRLGRAGEALELAEEEVALARRLGVPGPLGRALRVSGVLRPGSAGIALLEEAVAVLAGSEIAIDHARALVDLGMARRHAGRQAAAREPLAQALRMAESFGAEALRGRAEEELRAAGGRRRTRRAPWGSGTSLTPTQHRVAQLAAQGLTNPQIAQRLYLTTKTVEWHLGQVYRELGIAGRRQLADVVPDRAADPA